MRTRIFMLMGALAVLYSSLAISKETNICIDNKSRASHEIDVSGIHNVHWEHERPDHNFRNLLIRPGQIICKREDINSNASPHFNFIVDGHRTRMLYRDGEWWSAQSVNNPVALWGTTIRNLNGNALAYLRGGVCSSSSSPCDNFEIRDDVAPPTDWMAHLDNNKLLSTISIPGTHDSAAYKGGSLFTRPFAITQYVGDNEVDGYRSSPRMNIVDQLNSGVRFIDARLQMGKSTCHLQHGMVNLLQSCETFFQSIYRWLDKHPNETIVMSIKREEGIAENFELRVDSIIKKWTDRKYWYIGTAIPTLGINGKSTRLLADPFTSNVRGRLVLVRRWENDLGPDYEYGIDASQWNNANKSVLLVQDDANGGDVSESEYETRKWTGFEALLNYAAIRNQFDSSTPLILNFSSGIYQEPGKPYSVAKFMNPLVKDYFRYKSIPNLVYGVVIMDFMTPELAKMIYSTNFPGGWGTN